MTTLTTIVDSFLMPEQARSQVNGNGAHLSPVPTKISIISSGGTTYRMPPLPESAALNYEIGRSACRWLDQYIEHSKKWSPRGHEDAHEAIGIWLLSTVAARRVRLDFGGFRFTNLYINQAIRTSVRTKTGTAKLGTSLLSDAGLDYLLLPDENTPQSMVRSMTASLPDKWSEYTEDARQRLRQKWAFAGQRGWFYDEFGGKVRSMMSDGSVMGEFRSLLRKFDDNQPRYEYSTIAHGSITISNPYLSLLSNTTPADLQPFAKRGGALWNDGFWARFVFIAADPSAQRSTSRYPEEDFSTPFELIERLQRWHYSLSIPDVEAVAREDENGDETGRFDLKIGDLPINKCSFGDGVFDAYYRYDNALGDLSCASSNPDLDGNYSRLPEKALRVAMLFASMENGGRIDMPQWTRAQEIAERWRQNLHNLYATITGETQTRDEGFEQRILTMIRESPAGLSARYLYRNILGLSSETCNSLIANLVKNGELTSNQVGRATIYTATE